jgi:heme O synthase-like polyprenyltransferase
MQAYMKMEFSFVSVVLGKILNIGLVSYIVFVVFPTSGSVDYGVSLLYIFAAGLLGIALTTVMNYVYASKYVHPIGLGFDREYMTHIFRISLPYGIALFLGVVYFKVDVVLLSLLEPQQEADISIALYSLPMKIVEVLMVL